MARHQVNAATSEQAQDALLALPELAAGDEVALCCSACGAVLERAVAPEAVDVQRFATHTCGSPRADGGAVGEHGAGRPPGGEE